MEDMEFTKANGKTATMLHRKMYKGHSIEKIARRGLVFYTVDKEGMYLYFKDAMRKVDKESQRMKASKEKGNVNVYMEFVNYRGEVVDSTLIAVLLNRNFANVLIADLEELREDTDTYRYRMEVV